MECKYSLLCNPHKINFSNLITSEKHAPGVNSGGALCYEQKFTRKELKNTISDKIKPDFFIYKTYYLYLTFIISWIDLSAPNAIEKISLL